MSSSFYYWAPLVNILFWLLCFPFHNFYLVLCHSISLFILYIWWVIVIFSSVRFSRSVVYDSLRPHESQHARPPCPSPTLRVYPNPCPWSWWCHPAISSSVIPFSSCPQSLPASGSFPMNQLFEWGGQSTGVLASASVLPMNTQDSSLFRAPQNKVCHCFHYFPIYLPWSDGTGCHDLSFLNVEFKPTFSLSTFTFIKRMFSFSLSAIRVVLSAYLRLLIFLLAILISAFASSSLALGIWLSVKWSITLWRGNGNQTHMVVIILARVFSCK